MHSQRKQISRQSGGTPEIAEQVRREELRGLFILGILALLWQLQGRFEEMAKSAGRIMHAPFGSIHRRVPSNMKVSQLIEAAVRQACGIRGIVDGRIVLSDEVRVFDGERELRRDLSLAEQGIHYRVALKTSEIKENSGGDSPVRRVGEHYIRRQYGKQILDWNAQALT
jgi:hypothetical protein